MHTFWGHFRIKNMDFEKFFGCEEFSHWGDKTLLTLNIRVQGKAFSSDANCLILYN